jgi:hypothetical protein
LFNSFCSKKFPAGQTKGQNSVSILVLNTCLNFYNVTKMAIRLISLFQAMSDTQFHSRRQDSQNKKPSVPTSFNALECQ